MVLDALEREAIVAASSGKIEGFWRARGKDHGKGSAGGQKSGQNPVGRKAGGF